MKREYVAIDLKSFYASVECMERGVDPMSSLLVVADGERSNKTICLAVTPALKAIGIKGRPRLFEVEQKIKEVNIRRRSRIRGRAFTGKSANAHELRENPYLEVAPIVAKPRMAHYLAYSTRIYEVYLKYIAPEDIHVYSIDEVFMDVTNYLKTYHLNAHELITMILKDVYQTTGITATAGIGTNLYLSKVAMDILAKKMPADAYGVRIAELNERSYRELLWTHRPMTDFWRVGKGYAKRLETYGIYTMGDLARLSLQERGESLLYHLFGVNAELLIDHAWGIEPCTMADIKAYRPKSKSISSGQVLHRPYKAKEAELIVREMTDLLVLELVEKRFMTKQLNLRISYDKDSPIYEDIEVKLDSYGREVPKSDKGTKRLDTYSSSTRMITNAMMELFHQIVDTRLFVRKITITFGSLSDESNVRQAPVLNQLDLFTDYRAIEQRRTKEKQELEKERKKQEALLNIRNKFGKNAILKGMNLVEGATTQERNNQIGGHHA